CTHPVRWPRGARHAGERAILPRSRARGISLALRRAQDAGAHRLHVEQRQAFEELIVMQEAVIVSAVRTPVGKAGRGSLANARPDDLAPTAIKGAFWGA